MFIRFGRRRTLYILNELPQIEGLNPGMWIVPENDDLAAKQQYCTAHGMHYPGY